MKSTEGRFPAWLLLLGALTALGPLSIDMYLPAFPAIAAEMAVERGAIERTLAVFLIGLALGQLAYGPISDRYGRRSPMIAGLLIYIFGSLGCALAASAESFTAWRLLQALGGAAGMVMTRAVIRDRLDLLASARAVSSIMLVMGIAPILAPLLGGWMLGLGSWRGIFLFQAAFGLACLAWVWRSMAETLPAHAVRPLRVAGALRNYGELLRDRRLMVPALSGGVAMAGLFAYIGGSPFVLISLYGIPAQWFGLVFGLNALGLILMSQLNAHWLQRRTPFQVLRRAGRVPPLAAGALLLMSLFGQPPLALLMLALFIYVASLGAISPNTGAIAMVSQGRAAGAASAVVGTSAYGCGMLAGLVMSLIQGSSVLPLASVMAACGLLSWWIGRGVVPPPPAPPEPLAELDSVS